MQDVFTLVGVVCALMVCAGFLLVVARGYYNAIADDYYQGLRRQIYDTASDLSEKFSDDDRLTVLSIKRILRDLNARQWPGLEDIACDDKHRQQQRPSPEVVLLQRVMAWHCAGAESRLPSALYVEIKHLIADYRTVESQENP